MKPTNSHRAEYERRLHRALEYIDDHLDETISLAQLAHVASFSSFHFHRIFSAQVGETFGSYLTRRRVEQAAARFASQPRLSVLTVALGVGFGSAEAFTRAFKKHYGYTPSQWKTRRPAGWYKKSNLSQMKSKLDQAKGRKTRYARSMNKKSTSTSPLQVVVKTRPSIRVAYLRYQGSFGEPVGRFWQKEVYPWLVSNNLMGAPRYGISHDDPQFTEKNKCRYDAGAEVGKDYVPSQNAQVTTLPGGLYACTQFRGTSGEVPLAWEQILRE
jgi:AraC family transcriptional regulator